MAIVLKVQEISGVHIISVSGKLTLGEGVGFLRHKLINMARDGQSNIILDLKDISLLDSSGIGTLVAGFATINKQGGTLKLLNVTNRVKDLLLLTKLYTVFEVFHDEAAALNSFRRLPAQTSVARG